jgi:hypothetical protein
MVGLSWGHACGVVQESRFLSQGREKARCEPFPLSCGPLIGRLGHPRPYLGWNWDLLQKFACALTDEHGLFLSEAITVQQRALNLLIDGNEIQDFFPHPVHVELPERGTNPHERGDTSITRRIGSRGSRGD